MQPMMPQTYPNFTMNPIKRGSTLNPQYPSSPMGDVTHGAVMFCLMKYSGVAPGLYHVRCNNCGQDSIFNIVGSGTIRFACHLNRTPSTTVQSQPLRR